MLKIVIKKKQLCTKLVVILLVVSYEVKSVCFSYLGLHWEDTEVHLWVPEGSEGSRKAGRCVSHAGRSSDGGDDRSIAPDLGAGCLR